MRVVFFTLLVCNLLLAAWLISVTPAQPPEPPPVPENLPRLELLAERDAPARPETAGGPGPGGTMEPVAACFEVGPLPTEADARRLADQLSERIVKRQLRRDQVQSEIGHWVYLPAFPDRETAMASARRLDQAGLNDYYVITAGDQENTISLGLYRERENAEGRVRRLQQLGFDARHKVRTETVPRYYLQLSLSGTEVPEWSSLLASHPQADANRRHCPGGEIAATGDAETQRF